MQQSSFPQEIYQKNLPKQKKSRKNKYLSQYTLYFCKSKGEIFIPLRSIAKLCHIVPKIPMTNELVSIIPSGKGDNWASYILTRANRSEENFWLHLPSFTSRSRD